MARRDRRLELDAEFKKLTPNVYYQAPASVVMKYPAIRYDLSRIDTVNANNNPYLSDAAYQVIVIDSDPDSEIAEAISKFPLCRLNRFYTAENLNHFVFILY